MDIKIGDAVCHKLGGPVMTVSKSVNEDGTRWICSWFVGGKPYQKEYSSEELTKDVSPKTNRTLFGGEPKRNNQL